MPLNMIYYQSSFRKNPFLLIPHWILIAYVLDAAFERFFDLSAPRVNSFVHPPLNQL